MRNLYLTARFFQLFGLVAVLFVLGYIVPPWFPVALSIFAIVASLAAADVILLFNKSIQIEVERRLPKLLSLSDQNKVILHINNRSPRPLKLTVIDELPFQFQKRDFEKSVLLKAKEEQALAYELRPVTRGGYAFGIVNVFAETQLGIVQRRFQLGEAVEVPVYPSVIQMKEYELLAFNRLNAQQGLRKIRRIGHSYEFEQIKNYVRGDDYRSLNWKATGRANRLMVNQYEDERSQQIYCILDKSRVMKMPFNGLSLPD